MRVLFRFDASPEIGRGHQSRCLALASCLHNGTEASVTVFGHMVGTTPDWIDHRAPIADADDVEEFLNIASDVDPDLIVIDRYGLSEDLFVELRSSGRRVLRLLDRPVVAPISDLVLDQSPAHSEDDYRAARLDGCELMIGARWALMSPAFFSARHLPRSSSSRPPRVLLTMGGSDPTNAVGDIIRGLEQFPTMLSITAITGDNSTPRTELTRAAAESRHDVEVLAATDDLAGLSVGYDIAVGAGGVSALERCAIGLPSVLVPTAENQLPNVQALVRAGAAIHSTRSAASLVPALQDTIRHRDKMAEAAMSVCDGLGALRCAKVLGQAPSVRLKPAVASDKSLVFGQQVLPAIRQWFRNPQPPAWLEHSAWFDSMIVDPRVNLWLIEAAGYILGQVRTDARDDGLLEVSVLVVPEAQGMGVATAALRAVSEEQRSRLIADIHPDNDASIAAFLRAGFIRVSERQYELGERT